MFAILKTNVTPMAEWPQTQSAQQFATQTNPNPTLAQRETFSF